MNVRYTCVLGCGVVYRVLLYHTQTPRRQTLIFIVTLRAIALRGAPTRSSRVCLSAVAAAGGVFARAPRTTVIGRALVVAVSATLFHIRPGTAVVRLDTPWTRKHRNPGAYPCTMHTPTIMSFILLENLETALWDRHVRR